MDSLHEERKEKITLDVSNIQDSNELHNTLKENFEFPDFYGMNWDAFWDAITGLVELPKTIIFEGWDNIEEKLPTDSQTLVNIFKEFNEEYPYMECEVLYKK
ncbi:barstar family protein [Bacillus sp. NSP9.1]|uniref:barstar family protein n=1 Tax=Bacillus sp. NSP9.1 TaxID=1071078 RepID=UPI0003F814EC|nr:barstar family protein [Bacillus sp. NSP9.1]QHZ46558.1 barnase inhibitor [Bacillus sp. NSP9.1]